jgi:glucose/arabinose dehydrogenase
VRAVAAAVVAAACLAAWPVSASGQAGVSYRIPPDNPFVGQAGAAPEVYALGLRNPFRFSFDRQTGDLLIGDVGGGAREEIDWIGAAAARGANFGWPCREGKIAGPVPQTDPRCSSPAPAYVEPLFDYPRSGSVAVTGGYVVRDPSLGPLLGRALYADFFDGDIRSLALDPANPGDTSTGLTVPNLASFGEDAARRLYVADLFGNAVHRLTSNGSGGLSSTPLTGTWDQPIAIAGVPGDPSRLLVGERGGTVRLVVNDVRQATPLAQVTTTPVDERGLLSVAAAPDFAATARLYVYYTDPGGDIRIDEFTAGARREILTIEHSSQGNHNGGQLQFGPDGCLWISTGDGGGQNDQLNNAQNPGTHLGKLLRIDPNPTGPLCGAPALAPALAPAGALQPQDTTPPTLRVRAKRRQRLLRLRGAVAYVRCSERCSVAARGRLRIGRARYRMRPLARAAQAGRRVRLKVRLTTQGRRALRRCARRGRLRRASVRLSLRATDAAGLRSPMVQRTVRVRR